MRAWPTLSSIEFGAAGQIEPPPCLESCYIPTAVHSDLWRFKELSFEVANVVEAWSVPYQEI
jgi:hypothetical protein